MESVSAFHSSPNLTPAEKFFPQMQSEFFKELAKRQKAIQTMLDQYDRETATTSVQLAEETREMVRDLAARFAAGDNNPDLLRLLQVALEGALGSETGTKLHERDVQIKALTTRLKESEAQADRLRQDVLNVAADRLLQDPSVRTTHHKGQTAATENGGPAPAEDATVATSKTVGQLIREARELVPLTQEELAEKLSSDSSRPCDRGTIIDWEKDRNVPRLKSLRKISEALSIPLKKLVETAKKANRPRKSHAKPY